jgi:uncharacterized protein (DUF2147 family)
MDTMKTVVVDRDLVEKVEAADMKCQQINTVIANLIMSDVDVDNSAAFKKYSEKAVEAKRDFERLKSQVGLKIGEILGAKDYNWRLDYASATAFVTEVR